MTGYCVLKKVNEEKFTLIEVFQSSTQQENTLLFESIQSKLQRILETETFIKPQEANDETAIVSYIICKLILLSGSNKFNIEPIQIFHWLHAIYSECHSSFYRR